MTLTIKIEAIVPEAFNADAVRGAVEQALRETGKKLKAEFAKTTESWTGDRPDFEVEIGAEAASAYVECYPSGGWGRVKWRMLDEGTREHPIVPRRARVLRYQREFTPKTIPRRLTSRPGGKSGAYVTRLAVLHPGNAPREWSRTLGEQEIKPFAERVVAAMKKALKEGKG